MIASSTEPPVMPAGLTLPRWAPSPVKWLYWRVLDVVVAMLTGKELQAMRRKLGLPHVSRIFRWWLSPQLILGLFPEWYGQPQPDWPRELKCLGFPLSTPGALDENIAAFCRAGSPPVAITFGTGMKHAARLFACCIEACRISSRRAILLTRYREQLPAHLPPGIIHCPHAPFSSLLPQCSAIIHHGGIGTVAAALAARTPQLILPIAYDQTDNGVRVKRLNAGDHLASAKATPAQIAAKLDELQRRPAPPQYEFADALELAADAIERLQHAAHPPI
jgi:UDP:flavonoid glycosyltransferase YjiC (YdhE family)